MNNLKAIFNTSPKENFSTQQTLTLLGLAGLTTLLVVLIPWLGWLDYPFRLLITMVHELGHGLTALLTGGEFRRFEVSPDGSGLAYTAGGWRFLIIPAGYLGVAVFSAILIMVGRSHRWSRVTLGVLGALLLLLSLRYGLPTLFSGYILVGLLTTASGVIFGGFFLWVAWRASPGWIVFLLYLVAIQAGLMAFSDLMGLIGLSTRFFNAPANDAQSMAELTYLPALIWAGLWAVVAVGLLGGAIWATWFWKDER